MATSRLPVRRAARLLSCLPGGRAPARYIQTENHESARLETSSAKTLMDIGTRRIFSSDHDIFRESVRKFFQEAVLPHHGEWEKAGQVSREIWEKAGQQGLLGVNISEEHGGIGGDLFSAAVVWEEQMYVNCTGPGFSLHSDIVMPYIANYGSKEQIKRFIPEMAAGKCIGAIAMTEPGAGSDLQGVRTYAKKDGSDWILNGSKVFITNGWMSDVVIVVAVTNREARSPAHGISLFLVEEGMKGFIKGRKLEKIGLKAQDTAELFFEDVRLPAGALLGQENKGFYYLMAELPQERLLIADMAIASCEFMFEETRNYVKQRKAFGKTVAHLQTVQHKLAELKTQTCVGRTFLDSCLQLHSVKRLDSATASMAKYWASDLQNNVATQCVQLHGGWGYMWEYPIAKIRSGGLAGSQGFRSWRTTSAHARAAKPVGCKLLTTAMTPALQEKAMKGHGICLSSSLSSRVMESNDALGMGSTRPVKEKMKDGSVTKITCSMLGFPIPQANHSTDCFNLKYLGSQSSKHYPVLMSPSSTFHVNNKNCVQRNSEEHSCSKVRNPLCNSTNTHFSQIINSESGEQVRGETLLGSTKNLPEMGKLFDSCLTESRNVEERQLPNCKGYQKNGFLSKALFINPETKKGDLFHQVCDDALEPKMNYNPSTKEQELNFHLLQCVSKQQALLSRAKRTQKRLQILLAKHVVKHCDQQMKCFVRRQLQRMKAFHDPSGVLGGSYHRCTNIKMENREANTSKDIQRDFDVSSDEIKVFARSTAGLLFHAEESLDSDATCSSSSEDDDEQISRKAMSVSDWKWLVDRANVGCRWTWLQAQISELEYKIQQLTDLHRQIRATKGMVILEEFPNPKDFLKKRTQLMDHEALLDTTGNSHASLERQDAWPEHDFEMSPSSPTLLLRNIEKQSAQLSEIISSLITPLNLSPTSSPLSSKSCKQKESANGISIRDSENNEEISCTSSWLVDQQHLKRRRKEKVKLRTSSVAVICTSARTRPLQSFQRRKLYKMSTAFNSNQQAMQLRDALFNTEEVVPASMWSTYELSTKPRTQKQLMLELDTSFHPVLSFPSEYFHYKGPPQQWICGFESSFKHQTVSEASEQLLEGRKKRHLSETVIGESSKRCEAFSFQHAEPESQSPFTGAANGDMMSRSSHCISTQLNSRRRLRSESSYDIDNIVIPMSLVAPSKLEKLQYKEILTPSWRTVNLEPLGSLHEEEEKAEDLSDDAYASRHANYEDKERARWSLWQQCRWPRRNRTYSRSSDGQDPPLKEKQGNTDLISDFSENIADATSEIHSSLCLRESQSSEKNQKTKSVLWERRSFPLKVEEAGALLCQDQITDQQENSDAAIPSDFDCTSHAAFSLPNNQPQKKSSSNELEEYNQVHLGIGSIKKQR
uniref:Long-chain specific acyl-CoA dehydrogenase, mitochondrial n=1 Tax=Podarcis muralis TaxID=64176 RepID=A0A670IDI5_PODMU